MKQPKRAGGKSKAPGRGLAALLARQGRLPPPCTRPPASLMSNTKKNGRVEGVQDRADEEDGKTWGSKSKVLAQRSTVRTGKAVLITSSNPKTVRSEMRTNPLQEERGLQTLTLGPLSAAVPAAVPAETGQRRRGRNNTKTKERDKQ